jgi:hypothetical protein
MLGSHSTFNKVQIVKISIDFFVLFVIDTFLRHKSFGLRLVLKTEWDGLQCLKSTQFDVKTLTVFISSWLRINNY